MLQILQAIDSILGDGTAPIGMGSDEVSCFVHDETAETTVIPHGTVFIHKGFGIESPDVSVDRKRDVVPLACGNHLLRNFIVEDAVEGQMGETYDPLVA